VYHSVFNQQDAYRGCIDDIIQKVLLILQFSVDFNNLVVIKFISDFSISEVEVFGYQDADRI